MSSLNENLNNTSAVYRSVEEHEQQLALDLWYTVFQAPEGFFERYFNRNASPCYQNGDTLGVWIDGQLVSALHIRRLYIRSRDSDTQYLCGSIANVATLEGHRQRGYSRNLLRMAIKKMEDSQEFDVSILGTGKPNHYSALGWKQLDLPSPINIEWNNFNSSSENVQWHSIRDCNAENFQTLLELHSNKPRTYQYSRAPANMFQYWTGWNWSRENAIVLILREPQSGYIVINNPDKPDDIYVSEWRASNIDVEEKLLQLAANEIYRRFPQTKSVRFHTVPQYISLEQLEQRFGEVTFNKNDHTMIRNIRLSDEILRDITAAYVSGHATFWQGDYF